MLQALGANPQGRRPAGRADETESGTVPHLDTCPGDDVVDRWGLHQHDDAGDGIRFADLVAQAAGRGEKVGVGERGLRTNGDDPGYVRRMFEQSRANAAHLAYENYHNRNTAHRLYPTTRHPEAVRTYRELWDR